MSKVDPHEISGFRIANARLLIMESRTRISAWQLLRKHTVERCRASRELLRWREPAPQTGAGR